MDSNTNSGVNTMLLIIIMVAIVGGLVWYFTRTMVPAAAPDDNASINVTLPTVGEDSGGGQGTSGQ